MRLVIVKSNLREALTTLQGAVGENQNLPILKNILIEATANNIILTATNLEIAIKTTVSGKIIETGKTTLPFSVFFQLIHNLTSERITLEEHKSAIEITTDNYRASIKKGASEEFPIVPQPQNKEQYITIPSQGFCVGLTEVVTAAQASDFRPELSSVLFNFSLDELKLVATDSFRLGEKTISKTQFTSTHSEGFSMLIPLKTTHELVKIFKNKDALTIFHDHNQVLFKTDTTELISRLTTGTFPTYQALIPTTFAAHAHINRQELLSAVRLGSIFGTTANEITTRFIEGKRLIEVFSSDHVVGENTSLLHTKTIQGTKDATFNWRYLADGLKAISDEEVFVGINEETKPALIRSIIDTSYFYILMPVIK